MNRIAKKLILAFILCAATPAFARDSVYFWTSGNVRVDEARQAINSAGYEIRPSNGANSDGYMISLGVHQQLASDGRMITVVATAEAFYVCMFKDRNVDIAVGFRTALKENNNPSPVQALDMQGAAGAAAVTGILNDLRSNDGVASKEDCNYLKAHFIQ